MRPRQNEPSARPRRFVRPSRAAVLGTAAAFALAACGDDPDDGPEPDPDTEQAPDPETDESDAAPEPDEEEPDEDEAAAPEDETDVDDEEVEPLEGEPDDADASLEAEGHGLAVTDVRVSAHDGFDRVTFELDGDDPVGYEIGWTDEGEATSQGSGEPIEVAGDEALHVALHGIALPPDVDADVEQWDEGQVDGPQESGVLEVVEDTVFEGIHTFVVGADERHDFVVARLEDPQRVVIDLHHDAA